MSKMTDSSAAAAVSTLKSAAHTAATRNGFIEDPPVGRRNYPGGVLAATPAPLARRRGFRRGGGAFSGPAELQPPIDPPGRRLLPREPQDAPIGPQGKLADR